MTRRMIVMIALVMGLAAPAWAGLDEGMAAHERGDYETALREWRPLTWNPTMRLSPLAVARHGGRCRQAV